MNEISPDHVAITVATYDRFAPAYRLTNTPAMQRWEQASMRRFADLLPGPRVLVPGCGDGRHSRYLSSLGLDVISFDLSAGMLAEARRADPDGEYRLLDMRDMAHIQDQYHGVWASGCLYHLTKDEFTVCVQHVHRLLAPGGIFYLIMKEGSGEKFVSQPGPNYPGGQVAQEALRGPRFYAHYRRQELLGYLTGFEIVHETAVSLDHTGLEFWLRAIA